MEKRHDILRKASPRLKETEEYFMPGSLPVQPQVTMGSGLVDLSCDSGRDGASRCRTTVGRMGTGQWSEELFGPVAVVYRAANVDEAVAPANESDFGLSGSVWSDDLELAEQTARRLDVGMAYVNEHGTSLAGLPFGGVRRSGFGRELGNYGVDEFVNKRLVRVSDPVTGAH